MTMMTTAFFEKSTDEKSEIKSLITKFASGADLQDAALLATVLHEESQQFFNGPDGLMRLSRENYLSMINQKKIGGSPRKLTIDSVEITGNLAIAQATMKNEKMLFENYFSLMKVEDSWQIISIIMQVDMS